MGTNLAEKKKSLYEILGVSPSASPAELKAAHRRLSLEIMSGKLGLSRDDCDHRLQLLDVALNTLIEPSSRDAYDMQLAAASAVNVSYPVQPASGSGGGEGRALQLTAAAEEIYRTNLAAIDERRLEFGAVAKTVGSSVRSLKIILRVVIWLFVLGIVFRTGGCMLAARSAALPPAQVAKAEEMLKIQAYYKKHGVRAANSAEVAALEAENRRQENERREEEFNRRKIEDENRRFIEESEELSRRLEQEQQRAEAEAHYEAMRRQREAQSQRGADEQ